MGLVTTYSNILLVSGWGTASKFISMLVLETQDCPIEKSIHDLKVYIPDMEFSHLLKTLLVFIRHVSKPVPSRLIKKVAFR